MGKPATSDANVTLPLTPDTAPAPEAVAAPVETTPPVETPVPGEPVAAATPAVASVESAPVEPEVVAEAPETEAVTEDAPKPEVVAYSVPDGFVQPAFTSTQALTGQPPNLADPAPFLQLFPA